MALDKTLLRALEFSFVGEKISSRQSQHPRPGRHERPLRARRAEGAVVRPTGPDARLLVRPSSGEPSWARERTLVAMKPDGVRRRRLVGEVIRRFERRGFKLVGMKMLQAPQSVLAELYRHHRGKPFYAALLSHMRSGPVVAMVWEGPNVVGTSRAMVGLTDPAEAAPGTIRGDFSLHMRRNLIHASVEGAQREIRLWFQSGELLDWADDGLSRWPLPRPRGLRPTLCPARLPSPPPRPPLPQPRTVEPT